LKAKYLNLKLQIWNCWSARKRS